MNNNYKPPFSLLIIDNWIRIGIIIPFLTLVFILTGYTEVVETHRFIVQSNLN